MSAWVLLIYVYAGVWAKGDSVTLHSLEGFSSQASCQQAGESGKMLVSGTSKEFRFVCIQKK